MLPFLSSWRARYGLLMKYNIVSTWVPVVVHMDTIKVPLAVSNSIDACTRPKMKSRRKRHLGSMTKKALRVLLALVLCCAKQ